MTRPQTDGRLAAPELIRNQLAPLTVLGVSEHGTKELIEAPEEQCALDTVGHLGERLAYSVAEAAMVTGLSRDLLYDQMRVGRLLYLKVGRRRIITRRSLEAFLDSVAS
jgi:excisionase family DNA binding protein